MYRLSFVINEIYNKYLPLAEKAGISLNLDFPDPTQEVKEPSKVKAHLDEHMELATQRAIKGEISINVHKDKIVIRDSGTILSKPACAMLSNDRVKVTSRTGFGTSVTIAL